MNYGNANDLITHCPRCGESTDRHGFGLIRSDEKTEKLAYRLQEALDRVAKSSAVKGLTPLRGTCMVGAATARIGSQDYTFATISGADIAILNQIGGLGKDVTLIKKTTAEPLRTISGQPLSLVQPASGNRNRDYPLGACAAQKLLMAIFDQQRQSGGRISSINMAEILWSDPTNPGHNRDWSTGSVVCSCDTCKRVVPQMLCDRSE